MATTFNARIEIGGKLPRSKLAEFVKLLDRTGCGFDWGDTETMTEKRLLEQLKGEPEALLLMDDSAAWGRFEDLEEWLDDNGFWFIRTSDAYYEYDAEVVFCTPDVAPTSMQGDQSGDVVVPLSKVAPALAALRAGNVFEAASILEAIVTVIPTVPPFEVVDDPEIP